MLGLTGLAAALLWQGSAQAFCGFYVSGADAALYNDATVVVLMRESKTTVLSMQNAYEGPPEDFAMVVPVPTVLHKKQVKTLPDDVFARIDKMAAPRLVEYWEQDPCRPPVAYEMMATTAAGRGQASGMRKKSGVKVEARFDVDEYQIVVLSAKDSNGLDGWLREHGYRIPKGAESVLRPYVAQGTKFFVARVNAKKVRFKAGRAVLSPLRMHYQSADFRLPVRLGLLNSAGTQDLLVHILARGQRYELANAKNVFIPTNIDVKATTRKRFGEFYNALFDATLAKHPGAVVTEYAWDAGSCDPCPTPPIQAPDLLSLGADVLPGGLAGGSGRGGAPIRFRPGSGFVLTRLHARYTKATLGDDLVFRAAPPMAGGRERRTDGKTLEKGAFPDAINNFQARYAIRHPWKGKIACDKPVRGRWGGPPGSAGRWERLPATPAVDLTSQPRGKRKLDAFLANPIPALTVPEASKQTTQGSAKEATDESPQKPARNAAKTGKNAAAGGASASHHAKTNSRDGAKDKSNRRSRGCQNGPMVPAMPAALGIGLAIVAARRRFPWPAA